MSQTLDAVLSKGQTMPEKNRFPAVLAPAAEPAISYGIRTANTSSNGWGIQEEQTHTLDRAQGVADCDPEMRVRRLTPKECSRLQGFPDDHLELTYGNATKAHASQILHILWRATSTIAREGWRPSIITALLSTQVLLAGVHEGWISWETAAKCVATRRKSESTSDWTEEFLQSLWFHAEHRSSPYRPEPFEQLARELGRPLSELPYSRAQAEEVLLSSELWSEAQRTWPLRYAQAKIKKDGNIAEQADGPRYKSLGNSMAVPCMAWIDKRLQMFSEKNTATQTSTVKDTIVT